MIRASGALGLLLALGMLTGTQAAVAQSPVVTISPQERGIELGYVKLMMLFASISLAPALLAVVTCFARIVVVLLFLRAGLGAQEIPPSYVLVGLAILLTAVAMGPTLTTLNQEALRPLLAGEKQLDEAAVAAERPLREFMSAQVRPEDLQLMVTLALPEGRPSPPQPPLTALAAAYVISELRAAFLIGFVIYLPFVVIDVVVGSTLASAGLLTLPAPLLALPFKILLFLMVDGWRLLTEALMATLQ